MGEVFSLILLAIGALVLVEGIFLALFAKPARRWLKKWTKNDNALRRVGLIEIVVGLVLLLVSLK
tara:strand:- start:1303 stop:1497 length:195 start_codon:yes stop_codon:yes gene_type:complete